QAGSGGPGAGGAAGQGRAGGLIKVLLHRHLVVEDMPLVTAGVAERAAHLLQAICVRSVEGRRRVLSELAATLLVGSEGMDGSTPLTPPAPAPAAAPRAPPSHPCPLPHTGAAATGLVTQAVGPGMIRPVSGTGPLAGSAGSAGVVGGVGFTRPEEVALALAPVRSLNALSGAAFMSAPARPVPAKVRACVMLTTSLLVSAAAMGREGGQPGSLAAAHALIDKARGVQSALSLDLIRSMRELGVVKALTCALRQVNREHPRAPQALNALLHPLEVLTRNIPALATKPRPSPPAPAAAPTAATTPPHAGLPAAAGPARGTAPDAAAGLRPAGAAGTAAAAEAGGDAGAAAEGGGGGGLVGGLGVIRREEGLGGSPEQAGTQAGGAGGEAGV
ncbi:hypothetical protein QJQ45_016118, partial [Haematococcus lacustris]